MAKNNDIIIPEFEDISDIKVEKPQEEEKPQEQEKPQKQPELKIENKEEIYGEDAIKDLGNLKSLVILIIDHITRNQSLLDNFIGEISNTVNPIYKINKRIRKTNLLEEKENSKSSGQFGKGGKSINIINKGNKLLAVLNHQIKYYDKLLKLNRPFINNQHFATLGNITVENKNLDELNKLFTNYNELANIVNHYYWLNEKEHLKLASAMDDFESALSEYIEFGFKKIMKGKSFSELVKRLDEVN